MLSFWMMLEIVYLISVDRILWQKWGKIKYLKFWTKFRKWVGGLLSLLACDLWAGISFCKPEQCTTLTDHVVQCNVVPENQSVDKCSLSNWMNKKCVLAWMAMCIFGEEGHMPGPYWIKKFKSIYIKLVCGSKGGSWECITQVLNLYWS